MPKRTAESSSSSSKNVAPEKGIVIHTQSRQEWQGPLPPPAIIREYDEIVENGAERLFKQFETESFHRRKLNERVVELQGRDLLLGKVLALLFAIAVLAATVFAISYGADWVAAILGGGMLTTIALAFMRVMGDKGGPKKPD